MSSYYPPIENINEFNTALFTNEPDAISQGQASLLYLSKVNSDTSTALTTTFNGIINAENKLVVGVNGNTGLNLEVLQQLYLYSVNSPFTDYGRILNVGSGITRYHSYSPIQGHSSKHDFYSSLNGVDDATNRVVSFETGAGLTKVYNTFEVAGASTFSSTLTTNNITADVISGTQNIYTNNTIGTINIGTGQTIGAINFGGLGASLQIYPSTTFSVIPNCSITATSANQLVNYTTLTTQGFTTLAIIQANANAWTNTNTFNSFLPTSTINATSPNQFVNYTTLTSQSFTTLALVQSNANTFTNTNIFNAQTTFNNSTPICSVATPTANDHLTRKDYVDTNFIYKTGNVAENINGVKTFTNRVNCSGTTSLVVAGIAQFNGTTEFSGQTYFYNFPAFSYIAPTLPDHLVNKTYADTKTTLSAVQSNANTFSSTTTFSVIPICSVNASANNELVNWQTLNSQSFTTLSAVQANNNVWTGTNSFNTSLPTSTLTPSSGTQLITKTFADGKYIDFTTDQTISASNKRFNGLFCTGLSITPTLGGAGNRQQIYITGTELAFVPLFNSNTYNFYCNDAVPTLTTPLSINSATTTISNTLSVSGVATFNSDITTPNIFCNSALYLKDYQPLPSPITYSSILVQNSDTLIFYADFLLNKFKFMVSSIDVLLMDATNTTVQNNFVSNSQATFNTSCPISSINPTAINHLTRKDYVDNAVSGLLGSVNTFTNTNTFSGDVILSRTKNNSTYATYNALNSTYIGYLTEVPTGVYLGTVTNTQYQLGAITLDSTNVGFWTCNYEVEINSITAGSISKIYVFISDNNVSTTIPITLSGAKANNFSTQTYTAGDSTFHSGSFSFLQSTTSIIYAVQLKIIFSSGTYQRKGQIRMIRII